MQLLFHWPYSGLEWMNDALLTVTLKSWDPSLPDLFWDVRGTHTQVRAAGRIWNCCKSLCSDASWRGPSTNAAFMGKFQYGFDLKIWCMDFIHGNYWVITAVFIMTIDRKVVSDRQPLSRKPRRRDIASPTMLQIYQQTAHSVALMYVYCSNLKR